MPGVSLGRMEAQEEREFTLEMTPTGLTEGRYRVNMVLFEMDEFGNSYDQELLLPAFRLEEKSDEGIVWSAKNWGHIRFAEATVESEPGRG